MTNPIFKAAVQSQPSPDGQRLIEIYNSIPGSSGPYCCPHALAAVLVAIAQEMEKEDCPRKAQAILLCYSLGIKGEAAQPLT